MTKYFQETKYISDSGGSFKYDHPIQNSHVIHGNNIHLLLHPIWWCNSGNTPIEKINSFLTYRKKLYMDHIACNCLPYQKYLYGENKNG